MAFIGSILWFLLLVSVWVSALYFIFLCFTGMANALIRFRKSHSAPSA